MATCNRGCWFWFFFAISILLISAYIVYSGWWLPIEIHKHRLRYNQLEAFELYKVDKTDWDKYNMNTQHIEIISYSQQIPYAYKYFIGLFNTNHHDTNQSFLVHQTWNEFSDTVDDAQNASTLYIVQYSATKCMNLSSCLTDYINEHQHFASFNAFIHTAIEKVHESDINSETASKILDAPRDVFQFIIMFLLALWLMILLEFFNDSGAEPHEQWGYLLITMFFGFCYFLWILTLSVIPIFFSNPAHIKALDYWQTTEYSLAYSVGDYDAEWWIAGVLMHGMWQWCLVLSCPLCCCIYIALMMFCCCDHERADKVGRVIVIPLMICAVLGSVCGTIGFIPLFIGNVAMWNSKTFLGGNDGFDSDDAVMALQILIGLAVILIVVPLYAVVLSAITKCADTKRPALGAINSVKGSMRRLPVVGSQRKSGDGYGKVSMTNYDVYT